MTKFYKDLEVTFNNVNEYKGNYFSFTQDGLLIKYSVIDTLPNSQSKKITVYYHKDTINPVNNQLIKTEKGKYVAVDGYYDVWYATTSDIALGEIIFRASLNTVLEYVAFKDVNARFYNKYSNYDLYQPLYFDVDVVDNNVSVTNLQYGEGKTIKYSLDDVTYQDSNTFSGLANGDYTIYVKTVEDNAPSTSNFTINFEV